MCLIARSTTFLLLLVAASSVQGASTLLANGKQCSTSSQCASNSCQKSKCANLVAVGGSCYKNNMCKSNRCGSQKGGKVCLAKENAHPTSPQPTPVTVPSTVTSTSVITTTTVTTTKNVAGTPLCNVPGHINRNGPDDQILTYNYDYGSTLSDCKAACAANAECTSFVYNPSSSEYCMEFRSPLYKAWIYDGTYTNFAYELDCAV